MTPIFQHTVDDITLYFYLEPYTNKFPSRPKEIHSSISDNNGTCLGIACTECPLGVYDSCSTAPAIIGYLRDYIDITKYPELLI